METAEIWIVALPEDDREIAELSNAISVDERQRAARFRHAADRARYIAAHAALRALLASRMNQPAASFTFLVNTFGKPSIADAALAFNLSHSGTWAAIGVTPADAIGVDIETLTIHADHITIANAQFSEAERTWLLEVDGDARAQRFHRLWVAREAFVKATGVGLSTAGPAGDVAIDVSGPTLRIAKPDGWTLHEGSSTGAHVAAAVVPAGTGVRWYATRYVPGRAGDQWGFDVDGGESGSGKGA